MPRSAVSFYEPMGEDEEDRSAVYPLIHVSGASTFPFIEGATILCAASVGVLVVIYFR